LPDTADTRRDAGVMLEHLAYLRPKYLRMWIVDNAPWCTTAMIKYAMRKGVFLKADPVGQRLCLTSAERARLKIRTIGAIGCTKVERAELRKKRNTESHRERRAEAGAIPREMSAERQKPWLDLGISRRTFYARKKADCTTCTDSSAIACETSCIISRDETVQPNMLYPNTRAALGRGALHVGMDESGMEHGQQLPPAFPVSQHGDSLKEVYTRARGISVTLSAENVATCPARLDGAAMAA
jgi:hypothetical protein